MAADALDGPLAAAPFAPVARLMSSVSPVLALRAKMFWSLLSSSGDISSDDELNAAVLPSPLSALGESSERLMPWIAEEFVPDLNAPLPLGLEIHSVGSTTLRPSVRRKTWKKSLSWSGEQPAEAVLKDTAFPFGAIAAWDAASLSSALPMQRLARKVDVPPLVSRTYTSATALVSAPDRFVAAVRNATRFPSPEIEPSYESALPRSPPPRLARNVVFAVKSCT